MNKKKQNKWNDPFYAHSRIDLLKGKQKQKALVNYSCMKIGKKSNPIAKAIKGASK